jgi:hypothetical protein
MNRRVIVGVLVVIVLAGLWIGGHTLWNVLLEMHHMK